MSVFNRAKILLKRNLNLKSLNIFKILNMLAFPELVFSFEAAGQRKVLSLEIFMC